MCRIMVQANVSSGMTLRVAILTELFAPHIGGQEYRYLELSRQLQAIGHQVEVFTLSGPGLPREEFRGGVTIHRGPHLRRYATQASRSPMGVLLYSLSALYDVLARSPFDIYLFNEWPLLHVLVAEPFARGTSVMDWVEVWSKEPVETLQRLASKLPDGHIAVSEEIKASLVGRLGLEPDRITVIHSGVDNKQYSGDSPKKEWGRVIYLGRLVRHKHVDLLIRALKIAHDERPELRLDVVGDGPELNRLVELAGGHDFIRFHGNVTESQKVSLLKRSWLLALPSEREGFPRVLAEAWAARTPVFVCRFPENRAVDLVIRWGAGVISPPKEKEMARVLLDLYENERQWKSLAENAQTVAKSLDWSVLTRELETFLYKLIALTK